MEKKRQKYQSLPKVSKCLNIFENILKVEPETLDTKDEVRIQKWTWLGQKVAKRYLKWQQNTENTKFCQNGPKVDPEALKIRQNI